MADNEKTLLMVISSPPYTIKAVDGLLTVLGVSPKLKWKITIFLADNGVHIAERGQRPLEGVYVKTASSHGVPFHEVNFEKALIRLLEEGVSVYASEEACLRFGLENQDLVSGVAMADYSVLSEEALRSKATFFF